MSRAVVVFEDECWVDLLPLTHTRPACRLRCGIVTLLEKLAAIHPTARLVVHARDYLAPVVREELRHTHVNEFDVLSALLLNGRLIAPPRLAEMVANEGEDAAFFVGEQVAAAHVSGSRCRAVMALLAKGPLPAGWTDGLPRRDIDAVLVRYPWDLVRQNAAEIRADFARLGLGGAVLGKAHRSAVLDNEANVHVAPGAEIQPGAILLGGDGPVYIGPGAKVMAGAILQGPVSVGANSTIKMQAKIYEGTSIGECCKVGGEVEESIFQAYSNKQHDGFLGHAVLGEWINLGADTNNSDLKNNYGNVKVTVRHREIDSGSLFVGVTMGDHSKTGINTMINTGTVVGVGCNLFGAGFPPKYVPSFCWGGADDLVEHEFEKFASTALRVMARRKRELTPAARRMLQEVYDLTSDERRTAVG